MLISRKVKTQLTCKKRFDQMCQKWFAKFCVGDFLRNDTLWSGRPVEVDSNEIQTLTENNRCSTTQEIANILKISKSIKLLVKMKNVSFILWKKPYGLFGQPIHLHNGVLLGHKKEGNLTFCNSMDGPGEYYANEISQRKTTTI